MAYSTQNELDAALSGAISSLCRPYSPAPEEHYERSSIKFKSTLIRGAGFVTRRVGIDRAVGYSLFGNMLSAATVPVTSWLILRSFSLKEQGYYYTFGSLLVLQSLFELGLGQCITQFTAHEFARLSIREDGVLIGDPLSRSRLVTLIRFGFKCYSVAGVLCFFVLSGVGYVFFSKENDPGVSWQSAWYLLCFTTTMNMLTGGMVAVLRGCNEVAWVARITIVSNLARAAVLSGALLAGVKLLSLGLSAFISLAILGLYVLARWGSAIQALFKERYEIGAISWMKEVWPFQWRIAVSWLSAYLIFTLINPIVFKALGSEVAGKFGITWSLLQNVAVVASIWNSTNVPKYCAAISLGKWGELDRLWKKNSTVSFLICALGSFAVLAIELGFRTWHSPWSAKMLGPGATLFFIGSNLFNNLVQSLAFYFRSQKREPFVWLFLLSGISVSAGCYFAARISDIQGVAIGNCAIAAVTCLAAFRIFATNGKPAQSGSADMASA